jgi:hypothetical protein
MRSHIPKSGELAGTLKRVEEKIDLLVDQTKMKRQVEKREEAIELSGPLDIATLLSLPDHLRKSAMIIMKLGKAMAEDVAKETGRTRAIESAYLNQLTRMGHVKKGKEGRRAYFSVGIYQSNVESRTQAGLAVTV